MTRAANSVRHCNDDYTGNSLLHSSSRVDECAFVLRASIPSAFKGSPLSIDSPSCDLHVAAMSHLVAWSSTIRWDCIYCSDMSPGDRPAQASMFCWRFCFSASALQQVGEVHGIRIGGPDVGGRCDSCWLPPCDLRHWAGSPGIPSRFRMVCITACLPETDLVTRAGTSLCML